MKITSINNQNSFKGLWGETVKTNEQRKLDKKIIFADYETKHYYPFGDESIEDVNKVLKENSTYKRTIKSELDSISITQTGTDVSVKQSLLFSAKQWIKYLNNKLSLSNVECKLIEQNLRKLHLEKYLKA